MVLLVGSYFYEEHPFEGEEHIVSDDYHLLMGLEDVYDCPLWEVDIVVEGVCIDLGIAFHFQFLGV